MALPPKAPTVPRRMDPKGVFDFYPVITRGDKEPDVLQTGEDITLFSVGLTPEAAAAGLRISGGDRAPRYANLVFAIVLTADPAMHDSPIFRENGLVLGIEIDFATNLDRVDQYTVGVRVVNK